VITTNETILVFHIANFPGLLLTLIMLFTFLIWFVLHIATTITVITWERKQNH